MYGTGCDVQHILYQVCCTAGAVMHPERVVQHVVYLITTDQCVCYAFLRAADDCAS